MSSQKNINKNFHSYQIYSQSFDFSSMYLNFRTHNKINKFLQETKTNNLLLRVGNKNVLSKFATETDKININKGFNLSNFSTDKDFDVFNPIKIDKINRNKIIVIDKQINKKISKKKSNNMLYTASNTNTETFLTISSKEVDGVNKKEKSTQKGFYNLRASFNEFHYKKDHPSQNKSPTPLNISQQSIATNLNYTFLNPEIVNALKESGINTAYTNEKLDSHQLMEKKICKINSNKRNLNKISNMISKYNTAKNHKNHNSNRQISNMSANFIHSRNEHSTPKIKIKNSPNKLKLIFVSKSLKNNKELKIKSVSDKKSNRNYLLQKKLTSTRKLFAQPLNLDDTKYHILNRTSEDTNLEKEIDTTNKSKTKKIIPTHFKNLKRSISEIERKKDTESPYFCLKDSFYEGEKDNNFFSTNMKLRKLKTEIRNNSIMVKNILDNLKRTQQDNDEYLKSYSTFLKINLIKNTK